jgi:hypothetical protein
MTAEDKRLKEGAIVLTESAWGQQLGAVNPCATPQNGFDLPRQATAFQHAGKMTRAK